MAWPKGRTRPPDSGRKPGTPNRATAAREAEIAASGLTPLDYMLKVLRDVKAPKADRQWAAEHAAPYVHPKLSTTTLHGQGGEPFGITINIPRDDGA